MNKVESSFTGLSSLLELQDWAFFFDANSGITDDGTGKCSQWVDQKNGYTSIFSSGNRPTINTDVNGGKYLAFSGSQYSNTLNIPFDVGSILIISRNPSPLSAVQIPLGLYNLSGIFYGDVTSSLNNEDLSIILYSAQSSGGGAARASAIIGYNRSIFHAFSLQTVAVDSAQPVFLIDNDSISTFDQNTFSSISFTYELTIGSRKGGGFSFVGDIAYVLGTKGNLGNDDLSDAHGLFKALLNKYS